MKRQLTAATVVLAMMQLASCKDAALTQEEQTYPVMTVTPSDVTVSESYSASIQGRQDIEIYPQVSGTILKVCVKEGQTVRSGQVLFVIDQVPYQAALRTATANLHAVQAQLETARLERDSKKALLDEAVISDYEYSKAQNEYAIAKANVEQALAQELDARNSLSYTEVRSPSDGIVGTLPYRAGTLVGSSLPQPLTTVSDHTQMYVYFSMTENQLRGLMNRYGSLDSVVMNTPPVRLQLNDGSVYTEDGRIESISGVINRQTGTVSVRSVFPNSRKQLLSGGIGNVVLSYPLQGAITIPQTATMELQDKVVAYKVDDNGTAHAAFLTVERLNDGKEYVVRSGLAAGDRIVTEGVGLLQDGMKVSIGQPDEQ